MALAFSLRIVLCSSNPLDVLLKLAIEGDTSGTQDQRMQVLAVFGINGKAGADIGVDEKIVKNGDSRFRAAPGVVLENGRSTGLAIEDDMRRMRGRNATASAMGTGSPVPSDRKIADKVVLPRAFSAYRRVSRASVMVVGGATESNWPMFLISRSRVNIVCFRADRWVDPYITRPSWRIGVRPD